MTPHNAGCAGNNQAKSIDIENPHASRVAKSKTELGLSTGYFKDVGDFLSLSSYSGIIQ